jgi:hypothetical protein
MGSGTPRTRNRARAWQLSICKPGLAIPGSARIARKTQRFRPADFDVLIAAAGGSAAPIRNEIGFAREGPSVLSPSCDACPLDQASM